MRFNNGELIKWRNIEKYSRILQKTERGIQPKTLFQLTTHLPELLFFMVLCHKILSVLEWYSRTSEDDNKGLKPENQGFTLPLQDQDDKPCLAACQKRKKSKFYSLQSTGGIRSPTGQQLHVFQVHSAP